MNIDSSNSYALTSRVFFYVSIIIGFAIFALLRFGSVALTSFLNAEFPATYVITATIGSGGPIPKIYFDVGGGLSEVNRAKVSCKNLPIEKVCTAEIFALVPLKALRFGVSSEPASAALLDLRIATYNGKTFALSTGEIELAQPNEQLNIVRHGSGYVLISNGVDPFAFIVPTRSRTLDQLIGPLDQGLLNWIGYAYARNAIAISIALTVLSQGIMVLCLGWQPHFYKTTLASLAILFVVSVSLGTPFNYSPDEEMHLKAMRYYATGALFPPKIGSAEALPYESTYHAFSYLYTQEPVYQIYGIISEVLSVNAENLLGAARLFQASLFIIMVVGLVKSIPQVGTASFFLFISCPQVLYLFTYFNGDALGLVSSTASLLFLVWWANDKYRSDDKEFIWHVAFFGLLYGVASISKLFYTPATLMGAIVFLLISFRARRFLASDCIPLCFFLACAAFVIAARAGLDIAAYGFGDICAAGIGKCSALHAYQQSHSSMVNYGRPYSLTGVANLLSDGHWLVTSLRSALIGFGYMTYFGPDRYYNISGFLILIVATSIWFYLARAYGWLRSLLGLTLAGLGILLLPLALSTYYSLTYDYQPQGRYLFGGGVVAIGLLSWFRNQLEPAVNRPAILGAISSFAIFNISIALDVVRGSM